MTPKLYKADMTSEIKIERGNLTERERALYDALSEYEDVLTLTGNEAERAVMRRVLDLFDDLIGPAFLVSVATL